LEIVMKKLTTVLAAAALVALAGCQTLPPGATPYSAEEIRSQLTNRTWLWTGGEGGPRAGIYYGPNGQAAIHWQGQTYEDVVWKTRNGAFCHEGPEKDHCWAYFRLDGESHAKSLWQPEHPDPYQWSIATDTVAGRRIP
jgi:hypothetical protein